MNIYFCRKVIYIKFAGHSRRLHIIYGFIFGLQSRSLRLWWYPSIYSLSNALIWKFSSSVHTSRGSISYILALVFHRNTKPFNYLSMLVLSTIVQKGGDCKSKVLPLRFWRLLDKAVEELILFSSINRYLGSWRMEFACRRSKDNSLQHSCIMILKPLMKDGP